MAVLKKVKKVGYASLGTFFIYLTVVPYLILRYASRYPSLFQDFLKFLALMILFIMVKPVFKSAQGKGD